MKLRRADALREEAAPAQHAASEQQRTCPQCGALIAARAKTCMNCGANLVAIAQAEIAKAQAIQREKREEAALRPTRVIVVVITMIAVAFILAIIVRSSQEAARIALTPTITRTPTRTSTPTSTPQPSPTKAFTPTPIPPIPYTVKSGDTPLGIATFYSITVESLMAFNGKQVDDLIRVGEVLQIPVPTPQPTSTPTPIGFELTKTPLPPTPSKSIYTVKQGDTLSDIADTLGVSMDAIIKENDIPDPSNLQVGEQLVIPLGPTPTYTPVPIPANATPTPQPNYPPVRLLTPLDGEIIVGGSSPILLQWLSSGILKPNELYRAEIVQVDSGHPPLSVRTLATSLRVPNEMFPAPADPHRTFRWKIEIIRQVGTGSDGEPSYKVVSSLSQYSFEWVAVVPSPTPTPTPTPTRSPR
jgi:LysM repeat protein